MSVCLRHGHRNKMAELVDSQPLLYLKLEDDILVWQTKAIDLGLPDMKIPRAPRSWEWH